MTGKKYTIEDIEKCIENWGMCKVEAPYIEAFLERDSAMEEKKKDPPTTETESTPPYNFVDPPHYTVGSIEVIDMMVRIWGEQRVADYCEINAFKYRMRIGKKPHQTLEQELDKAKWYEAKAEELRSKM